ncbi:hypothetical protein HGRIS_000034 [Hohenbuehelia grisea]|uniref:Autophagy-related protein 14 n=1 Tax=Hohenbuehelia grisea TaxID=104357 RepID=A0ABR3JRP5_9AGAR
MFHDLCGRGDSVFNISSTNDRHAKYRRLLQNGLNARATVGYWPLLEEEVGKLLDGLSASPEKYEKHVRRNASAVIMKMAYGYTVEQEDDFFTNVAAEAAQISGWAMTPGRWTVDYYPILRYIPSWFPGAHFKRQAKIWRRRLQDLSDVPHDWVKRQIENGHYSESFTSQLLRPDHSGMVDGEQEDIIKWSAGGLYAGATDTTISAILSFISLMALHPEVQRHAQAEIDLTLGKRESDDWTPKALDLNKLIYLQAVMKEVLRFAPIANLALPHMVVQEDEYAGYRIPKGATVMANVWAVMHDPATYPNPDLFDPSRHLMSDSKTGLASQPDPRAFAFGFGRRSCPERDRLRTLRETLASRRRTLSAARLLPSPPPAPTPPPLREQQELSALSADLARARSGLVQELVEVFNIVEIGGRPPIGGKAGTKGEWTIGDLILPVPGDIRRYPPDHINAVITHTIHFLSVLTFYLGTKLPFEVMWTGKKLGVGHPWIGAGRGTEGSGLAKWHAKHPLHLSSSGASQSSPRSSSPTSFSRVTAPSLKSISSDDNSDAPGSMADSIMQEQPEPHASFTAAIAMLLYNVCYLAFTQGVDVPLNQAGDILSNLWTVCCSPDLGRRSHETHPLLAPPTPPNFMLEFNKLLQTILHPASHSRAVRSHAQGRSSSPNSSSRTRRSQAKKEKIVEEDDGWDIVDEDDR